MKNKTLLKFLFVFLLFSACEVKWDMEISFEEDLSGSYSIAVLIDQEAQMYAVETGQSSIGGLDAICLLYTSPSPRDGCRSRMPSSA